jgi:Nitroreductase
MKVTECIKTRRSIRKYKSDKVDKELIKQMVEEASYSPSWKHTQIPRYTALESVEMKARVAKHCAPYNAAIVEQAPVVMVVSFIKARSGYERDGSFTTAKGSAWQMFDTGIACQTFCLAAHDAGLGTVIMGVFDDAEVAKELELPETQEVAALIAVGYADIAPEAPVRKSVEELLAFR